MQSAILSGLTVIALIVSGALLQMGILVNGDIDNSFGCGNSTTEYTPIAATASSTGPPTMTQTSGTGTRNVDSDSSDYQFVGEKVVSTNSALYDLPVTSVQLRLGKVGSPTGNATIVVLDNAMAAVKTYGIIDVTTLPAYNGSLSSLQTYTYSAAAYNLQVNDRIGIQYLGGNATNYVSVETNAADVYDGITSIESGISNSAWVDSVTVDMYEVLTVTSAPASNAIDGSTTSYWQNGQVQETDAYIYVDLGVQKPINDLKITKPSQYFVPSTVSVYVSDSTSDWGTPVVSGVALTQAANTQTITLSNSDDLWGRYIKMEVDTWGTAKSMRVSDIVSVVTDTSTQAYESCDTTRNNVWLILNMASYGLMLAGVVMLLGPRLGFG